MPALVNITREEPYLLRIYHQTVVTSSAPSFPPFARDVAALGYVLLRERSSLAAYGWLCGIAGSC